MKNTRATWATMTATKMTAVQWWTWRIRSPARTSNDRLHHGVEGRRDRGALQGRVGARIDDRLPRGHEEEREEGARREQDEEAEQRDLAQQERPVVGEHLAQGRPHEVRGAGPLVEPGRGRLEERAVRRVVARGTQLLARLVGGAAEMIDRGLLSWLIRRCRRSGRSGRMRRSGRRRASVADDHRAEIDVPERRPDRLREVAQGDECRRRHAGSAAAAAAGLPGRTPARRRAGRRTSTGGRGR